MLTKRDYQTAIDAQDATNLSGVVHAFSRILPRIWESVRAEGGGTEEVNTHPITILFVDKLRDLTRMRDSDQFFQAMKIAREETK